ncbi:hypothetical protein [Gallaecimonas mangrovi]|nr:hypothetical protein [Gallaecimonas mangrovi]
MTFYDDSARFIVQGLACCGPRGFSLGLGGFAITGQACGRQAGKA